MHCLASPGRHYFPHRHCNAPNADPSSSAVGWAKAHSAVPTISLHEQQDVGTLRFAHPTRSGLWQAACRHGFAFSRRISPELCLVSLPSSKRAQGRPGAGWHPRSAARKARAKRTAQQHTGVADHSAFPARWLDGLCRDLPGADHSFWPPSPFKLTMPSTRLGSRIFEQLDRGNDGQDHTVLPYARPAMSPQYSRTPSTEPETYRRDEA